MASFDEINKLKQKLADLEEQFANATGDASDQLAEQIEQTEKLINLLEQKLGKLEDQIKLEEELVKKGGSKDELLRLQIQHNVRIVNEMKKAAIESGEVNNELQEQIDKLEKINDALQLEREVISDIKNRTAGLPADADKFGVNIAKAFRSFKNFGEEDKDLGLRLSAASQGFKNLAEAFPNITKAFTTMMDSSISAIKEMTIGFDEQSKAFERQFAVGERYTKQIEDQYLEMNELAVSMENVTEATGRLITNFTDFTFISDQQQRSLEQTAILLERNYGITDEFSKGMQIATKAMGMTVPEAENLNLELVAVADALELAPQAALAAFESLGPQVAKYGSDIGKNFKEVMRLSKLTGMEMGKIISIADGFDTFESAAERTGMLNAALGGNFVNAMDMMMETDPSKRFEMISDAINQTGLSFQEMGYYQKQFFAEAAGLDNVNDLALLMSGRMDLMTGATNASAESIIQQEQRAKDLMTIMEQLKVIFIENGEFILKFTGGLAGLAQKIESLIKFAGPLATVLFPLALGMKFLKFLLTPLMGGYKAYTMLKALGNKKEIADEGVKLKILQQQNIARGKGVYRPGGLPGTGGKPGVPAPKGPINPTAGRTAATGISAMKPGAIMALAVPLLALGAGLGAAAFGFSYLADSMAKMNVKQMTGLAVIVGGLSVLFFKFSAALMTMAPAAAGATPPLTALGAAVALLGLGLGLAGGGIALMAMGFSELNVPQLIGVAGAIIAIGVSMKLLAALGTIGIPVLKLIALGLLAMGAAAMMVGVGMKLAADSFKDLSPEQMYGLATAAVALGAGLAALAVGASLLGNPLALKGLAVLSLAGAGIALVAKGLGVFKKEKEATKELGPTISAFGGVSKEQFKAAEQAFAGMENSLSNMSSLKLLTMSGALNAVAKISNNMATATPTAAQTIGNQPTQTRARNTREKLEVTLNFENPFTGKFESEVLDIVRDEVNSEVTYALQYGTSPI